MNKEDKPWCPRCDQGWVHPIKIYELKINGYVCEECNAFWFTKELISQATFIPVGTFLSAHGIEDHINSYDVIQD